MKKNIIIILEYIRYDINIGISSGTVELNNKIDTVNHEIVIENCGWLEKQDYWVQRNLPESDNYK